MIDLTQRVRMNFGLAAAIVLTISLAFLLSVSADSASATKQRLQTGIFGDNDAKLSMVLRKDKKGKPTRVTGLRATEYDLKCQTLNEPDSAKTYEVDFAFPAIDVKRERKGKYEYSFSAEADKNDPFTDGFYLHAGVAEGWFTTDKKGKLAKLVGYLSMGGFSNSVPGVPPPGTCADPVRNNPFAKQHGSFSVSLR